LLRVVLFFFPLYAPFSEKGDHSLLLWSKCLLVFLLVLCLQHQYMG